MLGTTLRNKNFIQEEIKSRLKTGKTCYHTKQTLTSSNWPSNNLKRTIYTTIILSFVLYGCETWSLTLREESDLRLSENMVLRRIFWPKR
jgi:hypothetical protein